MRSLVKWLPALVGLWLILALIPVWAGRLVYPYDLEWMEGGMLAHGWRVQHGLPLYTRPAPEWIPFIYPPGYAWLLAGFGGLFGLDYALGRALSLVGTLAASAAAVTLVRREGGGWPGALAAVGLFLACYVPSGAFFDLVRLDGFGMGVLAWSLVLATVPGAAARRSSAVLLAAAFLFKQNVALFGLPVALALWQRDGWRGAVDFALWSAGPALAVTGALQWQSEGLYLRYLVGVPASHPMIGDRIFPGTPRELGGAIGLGALVASGWLVTRSAAWQGRSVGALRGLWAFVAVAAAVELAWPTLRGIPTVLPGLGLAGFCALAAGFAAAVGGARALGREMSWKAVFGLGVAVVAVFSSAMMRGHHGGYVNVHIPLFWVVAVGAGIALGRLEGRFAGLASVLVAVQIGLGAARVNADQLVPGPADVAVGDALVAELAEREGPVLSPYSPWLAVRAGEAPGFHLISFWDVRHEPGPFEGVDAFLEGAARGGYWGAIVEGPRPLPFEARTVYHEVYKVKAPMGVFQPRTGWPARPGAIKARREGPRARQVE